MREAPPRDPRHNLDEWIAEQDSRAQREERARREEVRSTRDVYEVADKVLAPFMSSAPDAVPRGTLAKCTRALIERGQRVTRASLLAEAARRSAQEAAARDPELAVAITLRAAYLFNLQGEQPRRKGRGGFSSVGALLAAAFSEWELGLGPPPRDAEHARGENSVDRRVDAQAVLYRSRVDLSLLPLLFERRVLGRYATRAALSDELRLRAIHEAMGGGEWGDAARKRVAERLPRKPVEHVKPTETEREAHRLAMKEWREKVTAEAWGGGPPRDKDLLRAVEDAEYALQLAVGEPEKKRRATAQRSRDV